MPIIIGVRFKDSGKVYHFDPNGHALHIGDAVVVETIRGLELGKVAVPIEEVAPSDLYSDLKLVIRQPTYEDYDRIKLLESRQDEVLKICSERIVAHKLPMRLVKGEWSFDGSRLTIYFTSQQRVDFRHLVRELARTFHARIELRQVGARDEAKLLGGIGPCGRPLCCSTFLPDFARVSVKMAKDQDLPLNPAKISGVCGRLLCCLSYEQDQYLAIKDELPRRGDLVMTPEGVGMVVAVNTIRETVTVDVEGTYADYKAAQLSAVQDQIASVARDRIARGEAAPIANDQRSLLGKQRSRSAPESRQQRPPGGRYPRAEPGLQPGTEQSEIEERGINEPAVRQDGQRPPAAPGQSRPPGSNQRPNRPQRQPDRQPGRQPDRAADDQRRQRLPVTPELLTTRQRQDSIDPDEPKNTPRRRKRGQHSPEQRPAQQSASSAPPRRQSGSGPAQQRGNEALPPGQPQPGGDDGQRSKRRRRRGNNNPPKNDV